MKKSNGFYVFLGVLLIIQTILMFLTLAYGELGEYTANKPSNIWSIIWTTAYIGLWQILSNLTALISGIVGLVKCEGDATRKLLSILLILSFFPGAYCMIIAIGSHF